MEMNTIINRFIIIFLFLILLFESKANARKRDKKYNYNLKNNKNQKKETRETSANYFNRKLDGDVEYGTCETWLNNDDNFHDLNIYVDTLNIDDILNTKPYKNILLSAVNNAKDRLESLFRIYDGTNPIVGNETIKSFGIEKWNEDLIGDKLEEKVKGMFFQGYSYILWFKYASDSELEDMGDKIALAKPVIIDHSCGQPEVGIITLKPNYDYSQLSPDYLEKYLFHLLTHLLAFDYKILQDIQFEDVIEEEEIGEDEYKYYIKSNRVIQFAKKYYNCYEEGNELEIRKIEIIKEENGNLHWPSRLLLGDYMTDFIYPEEQVISQFTLALFEDLKYLKLKNKYTGGLMRFGKGKGCNFVKKRCIGDGLQFENEFYYPDENGMNTEYIEPSCSSGRLSKTVHKLIDHVIEIQSPYKYFNDYPSYGGLKSANYCPVSQSNSEIISSGYCSNINNNPNEERGESFSSKSFCALSSLIKDNVANYQDKAEEINAICFEMNCSEQSLTIKVGDNYFVCPREGGKIDGVKFAGFLLCPDYNLICTGNNLNLCNDIFNCFDNHIEDNDNTYTYNYDIQTTQVSSLYKTSGINYGWEITTNGICPQYCMQCKENKICIKCKSDYDLLGSPHSQEIECELLSILENKHYQLNSVYYPCIENCYECENGSTCRTCDTNFKLNSDNTICIPKVDNCKEYDANEQCKECNDDFYLVKINGEMSCKELSEIDNKYYEETRDGLTYYVQCSDTIDNCERCTSGIYCIECFDNYEIMDNDHSKCEDLSKYYYDSQESKYKLCSTKIHNCENCAILNNNNINCNKCEENYVLINSETSECRERTLVQNDNNYFTDDGGLNYYLCNDNEHHLVYRCLTCLNKETCESCQSGYTPYNSKKLCLSDSDISDKKYYQDINDNNYYLCSKKINGCIKCNNGNTCIECDSEYSLDDNNKCLHSSSIALKYYLDPNTGKYSSCTKIDNCEECTSSTQCIKCQSNYKLKNNICELNENDYNKIKSMAIGAIILGTLAIIISIAAVILILYNKILVKVKRTSNSTDVDYIINNEEIKTNEVVVSQSTKRNIHNNKKEDK